MEYSAPIFYPSDRPEGESHATASITFFVAVGGLDYGMSFHGPFTFRDEAEHFINYRANGAPAEIYTLNPPFPHSN